MIREFIERIKARIVPNWKTRLRDISTIALAMGTATVATWAVLPDDLKAFLPTKIVAWWVGALNFFGLGGKFVVQNPTKKDDQ